MCLAPRLIARRTRLTLQRTLLRLRIVIRERPRLVLKRVEPAAVQRLLDRLDVGRVLCAEPGPPCPLERAADGRLGHVVERLGHDDGVNDDQQDRDLSFIFSYCQSRIQQAVPVGLACEEGSSYDAGLDVPFGPPVLGAARPFGDVAHCGKVGRGEERCGFGEPRGDWYIDLFHYGPAINWLGSVPSLYTQRVDKLAIAGEKANIPKVCCEHDEAG